MRSLAFFLAILTLAPGCVLEDKPVIPEDGGVEAGPCGVCEFATPVCNDELQCVECTAEQGDLVVRIGEGVSGCGRQLLPQSLEPTDELL